MVSLVKLMVEESVDAVEDDASCLPLELMERMLVDRVDDLS